MPSIYPISPSDFSLQFYETQDENLISQFNVNTVLTGSSYMEFYVYDNDKTILNSTTNYNSYKVENDGQSAGNNNEISQFKISPGDDVENLGFGDGKYIAYYNFLTKQVGDPNTHLFISEISSDRTEVRLDSNILSNLDIVEQTNKFIQFRDTSTYFVDFYLNFGDNELIISNNIKLENEGTDNPTVVVKLYEPLPSNFNLKNQLWIVSTFNEPEAFIVDFPPEPIDFTDSTPLQGPNFNLPIKDQVNNSSENLSYNDLLTGAPTSSLNQLNSLLDSGSINISVDYTDFNDFIHFSSVQTRLENFQYKVSLIEQHSASISTLSTLSSSATSTTIIENKISDLIQNFDKFEYFLYYNSGSQYSWPKTTSTPPYLLAKTGSVSALTWFGSTNENNPYYGGRIFTASEYDNSNKDQLLKSIPEYLRDDSANQPYELFIDMVAQYYDNVWIYTKDVTQKYNADNRLDYGISKDLVSDAIKDFGIKLYQNNFSQNDLYTAFLGLTPSGSLFPFPEITGSLPTPTGFEYVDTLISASNDIIPLDDVNKSLYKRLYHNIPYLLKSKGTIAGLRALITSYGIPDTILKISEFGGKDKVNENDWDYYFNKFNYAWDTTPSSFLTTDWVVNSNWGTSLSRPSTIEFRFKAEDILPTNLSQSLWSLDNDVELTLEYSGSSFTSGSYSGSIKDPFYQYANLKFYPSSTDLTTSASVYLPFFNGDWWSVMVTSGSSNGYGLYASNKINNGKDGTEIGYFNSSSISPLSGNNWSSSITSYISRTRLFPGFSGSIQEVRYYSSIISESIFKDYVMNPLSIESNGVNSSPNDLIFRVGLGSELDVSNTLTGTSIHPKVTGSWITTSSFVGNSTYTFNETASYNPNTEYYFLDQFPAGIKNRITDKVRYEDNVVPTGDTLSPYRRITQQTEASASYTENINLLEVAFSPQNEINDDIISQLGYFNIGDYIGDPRQRSSSLEYYPDFNNLRDDYFEKYLKNYNLVDFVRLIKFFDNSLFKMIKDFVPARTSLASGIVIKQHLLERNKYPQPQVSYSDELLTGSVKSHQVWDPVNEVSYISSSKIESFSGGAGGMMNSFNLPPKEIINKLTVDTRCDLKLESTIRGTLDTFTFPSAGSQTSFQEFYDGEDIYILASGPIVGVSKNINVEWELTDVKPNYSFSASSGITNVIDFLTNPFTGSIPITQGKNIVWDSTNGYFNVNYLPKNTLYTSDVNFQRWNETIPSLSGSITTIHDSQREFYDGEFSGSHMVITNGELNSGCDEFKKVSTTGANYKIRMYSGSDYSFGPFIDTNNYPLDGNISIWYQNPTSPYLPPPDLDM